MTPMARSKLSLFERLANRILPQLKQEARNRRLMKKILVTARQGRTHTFELYRRIPVGRGGHRSDRGRKSN